MKMDDMVSYLESKGFKTSKKYVSEARHYEFHIEKDGNHMVSNFKYPEYDHPASRNKQQEGFLDCLVQAFEKEYGSRDVYIDQLKDRLRPYVEYRGFSVVITQANSIYHIIVWKPAHQRGIMFHRDDPTMNTFGKIRLRVDEAMDSIDNAIMRDKARDNLAFAEYCEKDVEVTMKMQNMWPKDNPYLKCCFNIKKVYFNNPVTVVLWTDGTKTIVRCENETFDPEKGLAMAISKKALGNKGNYYNTFTKWLPKEEGLQLNLNIDADKLSKSMHRMMKAWDDFCGAQHWEDYHD